MIVEMRTYMLKPGSVPEAEARFEKHLPNRMPFSALGGLWHTVTGQMNTIVHLWPYDSVHERMTIREEAMDPPRWPPPLREFLVEMDAQIFLPAPFSPELKPARHGALYEFCVDTFLPGGTADYCAHWPAALPARMQEAPLIFCGTSEFGRLNQLLHVWAYRDATHRDEVQARLRREGIWPPTHGTEKLLRQEVILAQPAACSPLA